MTETEVELSLSRRVEFLQNSRRKNVGIQMVRHQRFIILMGFLFAAFAMSACVSVSISQPPPSKAKKVSFTEPQTPFAAFSTENADKAWQSEKTGATIAYLSECQGNMDTQLKTVESESLTAITRPVVLSSKTGLFNERESIETLAEGSIDGIHVKISLVVFKKNGCNFTITYMGRKTRFDSELNLFSRFKESFVVP